MKKTAISFTPFDNRNDNGQPSIGPSTQKSIVPTNNVHTIQDILNGSPYKTPGSGGDWGVGENSQPGSYKPEGADYKRQERDMSIINNMLRDRPSAHEIWRVKVPGGSKDFMSFNTAQEYTTKLKDKGIRSTYVTRVAQVDNKTKVVAASVEKTFMIESINIGKGVKETGAAFCVAPTYFITCAHVINNYDKNNISNDTSRTGDVFVNIHFGETTKRATVVDMDLQLDISLLQCDIDVDPFILDITPIVGQDVLSIGSPHGYENNVSSGIVGSLDRKVYDYKGAPNYMFADMSIFPGNSGGPVVDEMNGKVVGMVTLIVSSIGGFGLNACLPSKYIQEFCSRTIKL
ncbi:serine protease [bacterium]|nr:MAG: serine protease [bacterium]